MARGVDSLRQKGGENQVITILVVDEQTHFERDGERQLARDHRLVT
jgi:hypothetical protein